MGEDIIMQLIGTLSFMFGVFLGEISVTKAFGIPKKRMFIAEMVVFVIISVLAINTVLLASEILQLPLSFFLGFVSISVARAFSTSLGYFSIKTKGGYVPKKDMNNIVFNLIRNMKERGMSYKKIEKILKRSGFKKKMVEKWLSSLKNRKVPEH